MVRLCLALGLVASWCAVAGANGRPAATSTINFEQGHPDHIAAGMTFGLLMSSDSGASWHWMCEKTVGYGGMYDPDYAYTSSGSLFATTFAGEKVMRDGCTFKCGNGGDCSCSKTKTMACSVDRDCPLDPPNNTMDTHEECGSQFVSADELSPDHSVFMAAADPLDANIYKSIDDGVTFPTTATPPPGQNNDWWDSLLVAPSNANIVYLSGYRFKKVCSATASNAGADCTQTSDCPGGTCDARKFFLMFRSSNGGGSFNVISQTNINASNNSTISFVGIDRTDPNIAYIHVDLENGNQGDAIYKTINGGGNSGDATAWKKVLSKSDPFGLSFLARSDGTLIAATQTGGTVKSPGGVACVSEATCNWTDLVAPPHINCLAENPATFATTHEVWACTHNFDSPGISGDGFGIMKSTDLAAWTGVLRFQDIAGPVTCGTDTVQYQQCVDSYQAKPSVWCCLKDQLGITDTSIDCSGARGCGVQPDSAPDGGLLVKAPKGCCESGGAGGSLLLSAGVLALLSRRRRQV